MTLLINDAFLAFSQGEIRITVFVVLMVALLIWSLRWVYGDAEARGKDGWLVTVLVFFVSWPISLLVWIALRPRRLDGRPD